MRQVEMFGYGNADIVGVSTEYSGEKTSVDITIYELKKGKIDFNAIGQVCRYIRATRRFIDKSDCPHKFKGVYLSIRGVVIGDRMGSGDVCYLTDNLENVSAYTYKIDAIEGLILKGEVGWFQTDEVLSITKTRPLRAIISSYNFARDLYRFEEKQAQNEH